MYKMPEFLNNLLFSYYRQYSSLDEYVIPYVPTGIYSNSFLPTAVVLWTNQDVSMFRCVQLQQLTKFKSKFRNAKFQTHNILIPVFT